MDANEINLDQHPFTIHVNVGTGHGWFEHVTLGDARGGKLWFEGRELVDADGTASLPKVVATALRGTGFTVEENFE